MLKNKTKTKTKKTKVKIDAEFLQVAQLVKNPPAMWETCVPSLGWEDPLEKGTATHSSSGLENSMDCIVPGVTKSQTGLSDFHFHFHATLAKFA